MTLELHLAARAFCFYDVRSAGWRVEPGEYEVLACASSEDIRARATVAVSSNGLARPHAEVIIILLILIA